MNNLTLKNARGSLKTSISKSKIISLIHFELIGAIQNVV